MIEIATGSASDVTVVLLGHDQAGHRARALHYYRAADVACVAVEPLLTSTSSATCGARLLATLAAVETPLVMLTLDADFVIPSALACAQARLRELPQAIAAQGYALAYQADSAQLTYHAIGTALEHADAGNVRARLQQYAQTGLQAWRAVVRLADLQAAVASVPDDLDFADWRLALSWAILARGDVAVLHQTDVVCELATDQASAHAREEQLASAVRLLRQWDSAGQGIAADEHGFELVNTFVRQTWDQQQAPLLVTSRWNSVIDDPERDFEPRQYVELPYYTAQLFAQLTAVEFLCHAWPTGQQHQYALEGVWVRQGDLMREHANDTPESLVERYWQALSLGLFSREVCRRLQLMLLDDADSARARELANWLERLGQVPGADSQQLLQATPSGQVLAAIEASTPDEQGRTRVLAHLARNPAATVCFVLVDLGNDDAALQASFDSLLASGMRNFKLVVLKAGRPPAVTTPRDTLHFVQVTEGNWVSHLNRIVNQLTSEWLMLLQAGDTLLAGGLLRLLVELADAPACQAIASDEVQRDSDGRLVGVVRPGSNLDLLRSQPGLMSRHWLVRREAVVELGGYSETCPHALELDLLLRLVESQGQGSLAHMDEYLVIGQQATPALATEALGVLNRHLTQLGYRSHVRAQEAGVLNIDFRHSATPLVSILLANEGDMAQLQACLTGILQRTRYPRYEVLVARPVEGGSTSGEAQAFGSRVRLVSAPTGSSRSQLLSLAAAEARGEYLLLLSEACQVINPAWIEALLNEAQRPEVGVVGARLWAPDGTLAHAGYALLEGAQVHSPWQSFTAQRSAADRWPLSVRSCDAVSGDCLMVRKEVFDACGGLVREDGADIELCLTARAAGLMVVWTPRAELLLTAQRAVQAGHELAERWSHAFSGQLRLGIDAPGPVAPASLQWLAQLD